MTDRTPFELVVTKAYGWICDDEGYLVGLVSGDMGYETTDKKFDDLLTDAMAAEWRRYIRTNEKKWHVEGAMYDLVKLCHDTITTEPVPHDE